MNLKKICILIVLGIILTGLGSTVGYILHKVNTPLSSDKTEKMFVIEKGDTVKKIGKNLEKENLISSSFYFETYIYYKKLENKLQAGIYSLSPSMSISEIVDWFVQGRANQVKITIPEGWRIEQIAERLDKAGVIKKSNFLSAVKNINNLKLEEYDFLNTLPKNHHLEGFLFPDTYIFFKNSQAEEVINKMLDNFNKKLDEGLRKEIKKQNKTVFEIVTLASIIEREAKNSDEMPKIASLYWNRLKIGMKLDADPTVQYAKGNWNKLEVEDYKKVLSPYNTYLYKGLPPGPICNPGLKAIKAVLYPEKTDYFYFFHTDDGKVFFSKTKEEHDQKKIKYLK